MMKKMIIFLFVICAQNCPRLIHYVFGNEDLGKTSLAYIPPELYENPDGERYNEDVLAIGMILYEILTGQTTI